MMPWKPGQSGNPKGRVKRKHEAKFLRATIRSVAVSDWREIVQTAVTEAKAGGADGAKARQWLAQWMMPKPNDDGDGDTGQSTTEQLFRELIANTNRTRTGKTNG